MTSTPPQAPTGAEPITFVADAALGRLARWLRLAGVDVAWGSHATGRGLLRIAREQSRMVLTRSPRFGRRPEAPPHHVVRAATVRAQFQEVVGAFGLVADGAKPRCSKCNGNLRAVADATPSRRVHRCVRCGTRVWEGPAMVRFRAELQRMGVGGEYGGDES